MRTKPLGTLSDVLEPERPAVRTEPGPGGGRVAWGAALFFYLLVAFEVIIMVTPFTLYFYSVYAPVLTWLERVSPLPGRRVQQRADHSGECRGDPDPGDPGV